MSILKVEEIQHISNSNNAVSIASDSSVSLKHSGSAKLATTSTGVSVTGTCTATSFTGDGANLTNLPVDLTNLNATNLTSGTIPDARFPATLPAIDGSNLTSLTLPNDRRSSSNSTDIYSGNAHDYTFYDADVGISWFTAGAEEMRLEDDGDLHVDGNVTAYSTTVSDKLLKTDIKVITGALDKICSLSGYTFKYKHDGKTSAGIIAQELEKVLPSAIIEKELPFQGEEGQKYKIVQYDQIHGLLIEAIKELKTEIEVLKNGITK
tara:strand:+ start:1017 stop:1811 length:795 start_codon:yes stop_codon:yes gene_type:complete